MNHILIPLLALGCSAWIAAIVPVAGSNESPSLSGEPANAVRSLAGTWSCRLDPRHRGLKEGWHKGIPEEHQVVLPGTTMTHGIGPRCDKQLISSLTPATQYVGPAWYWRDIELSEDECRKVVQLSLERCCWQSFAWLNGQPLGSRDSLVAPHVYDLSPAVKPGINRLTLMVDNSNLERPDGAAPVRMAETEELVIEGTAETRLKCGGHHTLFLGYSWNGITGDMELRFRPRVRMASPRVDSDIHGKVALIRTEAINDHNEEVEARLELQARELGASGRTRSVTKVVRIAPGRHPLTAKLPMGDDMCLWSDHSPTLYRLEARLVSPDGQDFHKTEFGMRELSRDGTRITLNGRPIFLRGTLEKFSHPILGYPPTDLEEWMRIFGISKAHGLNHVRFHSCCPPQAAFAAADRLGMILNVELPGCSGGEPDHQPTLDFLQAEALRILETFGNHPSFGMLTMGNEILSDEKEKWQQDVLMQRVAHCREVDPHRLYNCTAHAFTRGRDDDFYVSAWGNGPSYKDRHQSEPLRGFRWNGQDLVDESRFNTRPPETTMDYREAVAGIDGPLITHEVGMWAVYPDIGEIPRYDGALKPYNLEIIRDLMAEKGTLALADRFVQASGQLSLQLYKEEVESALRTPGLAGFQLLGLFDHPPQGTSTIGMVNALRESKGIVSPAEFAKFCGNTVPLARLAKRTFTSEETLVAPVDLAHYGSTDLQPARFSWSLRSADGIVHARGRFADTAAPSGGLTRLGDVSIPLADLPAPGKLRLSVDQEDGTAGNAWDLWVYPPAATPKSDAVLWETEWTPEVAARVSAGATVLLELGGNSLPHARRGCFTTLLWNPIMKRKHRSQTMGILCNPEHPALAAFPTEFHSNWQWWDVLRPSRVLDLDGMSPRPEPIVRMIDSFIGNHCLALIFEVKLGKGRLLVTSLDLSSDLDSRHAARQLRRSLLDYVASDAFQPAVTVEAAEIDRLIAEHRQPKQVPTRNEIKARFDRPAECE